MGIFLTFVVSMLTVGTRFTISPSQTGVVLSYIISVQQAFGWLVRQSAEVENDFNSVERIVSTPLPFCRIHWWRLSTRDVGTLRSGARAGAAAPH